MERLRGLKKLSSSQLLSVRELVPVTRLSAAFADDAQFVRHVEEQLQVLTEPVMLPRTVLDDLVQPLQDEPYLAVSPSKQTNPLQGGRTCVTVVKWDIEAESKFWLDSQQGKLKEVFCKESPTHETEEITREDELYTPVVNCLYKPVNLAAEVLGLPAKYSRSLERNTIVVHEIKDNWQERHYVAHLADLLTNADTEVRKRIARPVAQVLGYAFEEGVQYGILSSKAHFTFFKRGVPVDGKSIHLSKTFDCTTTNPTIRQLFLYMLKISVTAERLPYCQHAEIPEEDKVLLSNGSVGSFVLALQGSSTGAVIQQASSKRCLEDRDNEGGDDIGDSSAAVGPSHKHVKYSLRSRVVCGDTTASAQQASCISDVTIKESISYGKYCVVRRGSFDFTPAVYKVWEVADACEEDVKDPCWLEIRSKMAAYKCLQNKQGVAACLCWGALHDRTMIFAALPDYGDNLLKVHLTRPWVEGIKAAIKAVHSAGILHNDLHLCNFVGNAPNNVKLVDFAWSDSATSERSCQAMEREEKQFMETLSVQASSSHASVV